MGGVLVVMDPLIRSNAKRNCPVSQGGGGDKDGGSRLGARERSAAGEKMAAEKAAEMKEQPTLPLNLTQVAAPPLPSQQQLPTQNAKKKVQMDRGDANKVGGGCDALPSPREKNHARKSLSYLVLFFWLNVFSFYLFYLTVT